MQEIYRVLARLMGTDLTVMINGESGTGKELVARALHDYGKRRSGPFVAVNVAAIPRELIESDLFGHEKGAFTGALARSIGRFEQAQGGTLFLDEIGDMPLDAPGDQAASRPAGRRVARRWAVVPRSAPMSASSPRRAPRSAPADPPRACSVRICLYRPQRRADPAAPPLRERTEDIPALVRHFFKQASEQGLPLKTVDVSAMDRMKAHRWPGNVRELENLVRRLAALYSQEVIGVDVIDIELSEAAPITASAPVPENEGLERGGGAQSPRVFRGPQGRVAGDRPGMTGWYARSNGR